MARRVGLEQIGAEAVLIGTAEFLRAAEQVTDKLDQVNSSAKKLERESAPAFSKLASVAAVSFGAIGVAAGIITGVLGAIGGASVKAAADLEQGLGIVQAITQATQQEMVDLTETIRGISTTSIVSMGQAAEAAGELARGGIDIKDQLNGALQAVVDLNIASAGELEIGRSATLVASALSAFKLQGEDATKVVNALTVAAQNSSITFVDLFRSFQQAAPVASVVGLNVQELAAALGVLGLQGIRGSDAGTSLKQAFIQLSKPTKAAAELMDQYGISLFTASGASRPFRDLVIDLERQFGDEAVALGRITEAQRANAVATIFGSDAIRAAIVTAVRGTEAFDSFLNAMDDGASSAANLAKIMQQPLNAQLTILANNFASLGQSIGAGLVDGIKELVVALINAARAAQPFASAIGSALKFITTGFDFDELRDKLSNLFGPQLSASILGFVTAVRAGLLEVGSAFGRFVDFVSAAVSEQATVDAITQSFYNAANAVSAVSSVISGLIQLSGEFILALERNNEQLEFFKNVLTAIAIGTAVAAFVGLVAVLVAVGSALSGIIVPALAAGAAISGVVLLIQQINGLVIKPKEIEVRTDIDDINRQIVDIQNAFAQIDTEVVFNAEIDATKLREDEDQILTELALVKQNAEQDLEFDPSMDLARLQEASDRLIDLVRGTTEIADETAVITPDIDFSDINSSVEQVNELVEDIQDLDPVIDPSIDNELVEEGLNDLIEAVVDAINGTNNIAVITPTVDEEPTRSGLENLIRFAATFEESYINLFINIANATASGMSAVLRLFIDTMKKVLDIVIDTMNKIAKVIRETFNVLGGELSAFLATTASGFDLVRQGLNNIEIPEFPKIDTITGITSSAEDLIARFRAAGDTVATARNRIENFRVELPNVIRPANQVANSIGAVDRGARTTAGSMGDLGDAAGKTGKKLKEEAGPAIEGFLDAINKAARLQSFVDAFGDAGAKAIDALVNAVVSNIDKDGAKAGEALHDLIQELRKANVPEWEEFGAALNSAFANALSERSDEAIDAAKQILADAVDAMKAQGRLTLDTFRAAFNLGNVARQLGSDGSRLTEAINEAIAKGGTEIIKTIGQVTSSLIAGFADKVPVERAREFGNQIISAIVRVIEERTAEASQALQDLIRSLNFQAELEKLNKTLDDALKKARDTFQERFDEITKTVNEELSRLETERAIRISVETQIGSLKDLNDARLEALKAEQDWNRQVRALSREERDIRKERARDDVQTEKDHLQEIADARKKAAERAREALKGAGTPVGGFTIQKSADTEDQLRKELAAIEERFRREKVKRDERRKQEDEDRQQRLADNAQEQNQAIVDAIALQNLRTALNRAVQDLQDKEELRQHNARRQEIVTRGDEQIAQANRAFAETTNAAVESFNEQQTKLEFLHTLSDNLFSQPLEDIRLINQELDQLFSNQRSLDIKITQGGMDEELEAFQRGGMVPGIRGKPVPILAHAGEQVLSLAQVRALETRPFISPVQAPVTNTTQYNVSANYGQVQDPGSILLDLQALASIAGQ